MLAAHLSLLLGAAGLQQSAPSFVTAPAIGEGHGVPPMVAAGSPDGGFAAAWTDLGEEVVLTLFDEKGASLAPAGLILGPEVADGGRPSIALGVDYLVAWGAPGVAPGNDSVRWDLVNPRTGAFRQLGSYSTGTSIGGTAVAAGLIGPGGGTNPGYLVVWNSVATAVVMPVVDGLFLDANGLRTGGLLHLDKNAAFDAVSATWDGTHYWVASAAAPTVNLYRLAPDGTQSDAGTWGPSKLPALTWTGAEVQMAVVGGTGVDLFPDLLAGTVLRYPLGGNISPSGEPPSIAALQGGSAVLWPEFVNGPSEGWGVLVNPSNISTPARRVLTDPAETVSVAPCDGGLAAAYLAATYGSAPRVAVLDATLDGGSGPGQALLQVTNNQGDPGVASEGSRFLAVWGDDLSGFFSVRGALLDGSLHTPAPDFPIGGQPGLEAGHPAAAGGSGGYLVVYALRQVGQIGATAVALDGTPGNAGSVFGSNADYPSAAWNGTNWIVAWIGQSSLSAVHLLADGSTTESPRQYGTATGATQRPAISALHGITLVLWVAPAGLDSVLIPTTNSSVGAITTLPLKLPDRVTAARPTGAALSTDGSGWMLAWIDRAQGGLYAQGLDADAGVVGVSVLLGNPAPTESFKIPSMAFDGANYVVVWEGEEANGAFNTSYAIRVSPDGGLPDTSPVLGPNLPPGGTSPFTGPVAANEVGIILASCPGTRDGGTDGRPVVGIRAFTWFEPVLGADGGLPDAGADAGPAASDGGSLLASLGCATAAGPGAAVFALAALAAFALVRRRRS